MLKKRLRFLYYNNASVKYVIFVFFLLLLFMRLKYSTTCLLVIISALISLSFICTSVEIAKKQVAPGSVSTDSSTVLLNNDAGIIPLKKLAEKSIASLTINMAHAGKFDSTLNQYARTSSFSVQNITSPDSIQAVLDPFNTVILSVNEGTLRQPEVQKLINSLHKNKQLIIAGYGNAAALQLLDNVDCAIIWNAQTTIESTLHTAQSIFGGVALTQRLKSDISAKYKAGDGFTSAISRLRYARPEEAGINSEGLEGPIDNIVAEAISQKATPGAVVMVVKDGKVILNKAYGTHTYQQQLAVRPNDIFDLASITKIAATTIAAMRLYEQQKLNLDTNIGTYIPAVARSNKNTLSVKELLLHQGGLIPFIPFYQRLKPMDSSRDSSIFFPVKVADDYYLRANYFENVMWAEMLKSPLREKGKYVYSDLSMYFMKDIIERLSSTPLQQYVEEQFYKPLGMQTAGFNPRNRFNRNMIIPTEQDDTFRKTLLHGYVHDQGAAMAGGVAGHAGLFSSASDLAILFQMFLNGGTYGGERYFDQKTIDLFTAKYSDASRRGLGFDRWDPDRTNRYPSDLASPKTYGHTGYTGTCIWVDPEYNLIYIFLSNRVHPKVSNKLSTLRIRPRIQDVIYEAIKKSNMAATPQ